MNSRLRTSVPECDFRVKLSQAARSPAHWGRQAQSRLSTSGLLWSTVYHSCAQTLTPALMAKDTEPFLAVTETQSSNGICCITRTCVTTRSLTKQIRETVGCPEVFVVLFQRKSRSGYIGQAGFELVIFLAQWPECQCHRSVLPHYNRMECFFAM